MINWLSPQPRCSAFFPTSVLLSAGYTEPLALLLIVSFFLALKRKHYLSAALLAGLAVSDPIDGRCPIARPSLGDVGSIAIRRTFLPALLPCVLLATSGIWLFMIYLWSAFGTPFAFADGQAAFHQGTTLADKIDCGTQT